MVFDPAYLKAVASATYTELPPINDSPELNPSQEFQEWLNRREFDLYAIEHFPDGPDGAKVTTIFSAPKDADPEEHAKDLGSIKPVKLHEQNYLTVALRFAGNVDIALSAPNLNGAILSLIGSSMSVSALAGNPEPSLTKVILTCGSWVASVATVLVAPPVGAFGIAIGSVNLAWGIVDCGITASAYRQSVFSESRRIRTARKALEEARRNGRSTSAEELAIYLGGERNGNVYFSEDGNVANVECESEVGDSVCMVENPVPDQRRGPDPITVYYP